MTIKVPEAAYEGGRSVLAPPIKADDVLADSLHNAWPKVASDYEAYHEARGFEPELPNMLQHVIDELTETE